MNGESRGINAKHMDKINILTKRILAGTNKKILTFYDVRDTYLNLESAYKTYEHVSKLFPYNIHTVTPQKKVVYEGVCENKEAIDKLLRNKGGVV